MLILLIEKRKILAGFILAERVERNQRKIRKIYSTKPKVTKRNIPDRADDVTVPVRTSVVDVVERDVATIVEEVATITEQEPVVEPSAAEEQELDQNRENSTMPSAHIDLSKVMAPKELLKTDPPPPVLMVMDPALVDLDFGPAGDAGAFLGCSDPMPISDPSIRDEVLKEFPSLRRITYTGLFEDLVEDDPIVSVEEQPVSAPAPVPSSRLTTSTPVPMVKTGMLRQRIPAETSQLETADVSDISAGTPLIRPPLVPFKRPHSVGVRFFLNVPM